MAWRAISSWALAVNAAASASNVVDSACASRARTLTSTGSSTSASRTTRRCGRSGRRDQRRQRPDATEHAQRDHRGTHDGRSIESLAAGEGGQPSVRAGDIGKRERLDLSGPPRVQGRRIAPGVVGGHRGGDDATRSGLGAGGVADHLRRLPSVVPQHPQQPEQRPSASPSTSSTSAVASRSTARARSSSSPPRAAAAANSTSIATRSRSVNSGSSVRSPHRHPGPCQPPPPARRARSLARRLVLAARRCRLLTPMRRP